MTKKELYNIVAGAAGTENFDITYPPGGSGDLACNVVFRLAKASDGDPAELADKIITDLKQNERINSAFSKIEFAKPGFINFYYSLAALAVNLNEILELKGQFGKGKQKKEGKILVEYFQPNIAKPLHLGHLRTAIIGDALFRILKFTGHNAESDTHVGDWGTQFGLLLYAYKNYGDPKAVEANPIEELSRLYTDVSEKTKDNPAMLKKGKAEFLALERGDKENRELWQKFAELSRKEFKKAYDIFKFRPPDHNWPESFYEDKMPAALQELEKKGLLEKSDGAKIVNLEKYDLGAGLLVKSDGATTYLLRDIAGFIFKKKQGFVRQLFVVDKRQEHIFKQLFKILELMGYIDSPEEAKHISYGVLKLAEGVMSTRKGVAVGPEQLAQRAGDLALKIIEEKNPGLENKKGIAKQIAIGAIKYFDLSHNRHSDIIFEWDRVLNFEGNAGPYLQYTYARIKSILRKTDEKSKAAAEDGMGEEEKPLLRVMMRFGDAVAESANSYYPNILCDYLYHLASEFNTFYEKAPVLSEADPQKRSLRLPLIAAAAQILQNGLGLLGIDTPERM